MDRLQKFGRYSKRVINRLTKREVEEVDLDFTSFINEEERIVSWRIQNISRCPLETGEYYDSPSFTIGYSSEVKWFIRIYPKGRKVTDEFAVFVHKISEDSRTGISLKYLIQATLIAESDDNSKEKKEMYDCSNQKKAATAAYAFLDVPLKIVSPTGKMVDENEKTKEYGTDALFPSKFLVRKKSLLITCQLNIVYLDGEGGNCISGPPTSSNLYNDLTEMYKSGNFSDVTLKVGTTNLPAHKAILAVRSKVFAAMFDHNMKESQNNIIDIEDVEPSVMSSVLQYIYTGKVEILTIDEAASIFSVADKYSLEELQNWCIRVMLAKLSVENVCRIAILADMHSVPRLKTATNSLFRKYWHEIVQKKEWKRIIDKKPQLASDILHAVSSDFNLNLESDHK